MANLDFLSIPIGRYIEDYLRIGRRLRNPPRIFSANYFLRDERGEYLNSTQDKRVWLKWMELRVHGDVGAVETPTGYAPIYEDLEVLFRQVLGRKYTETDYERQFAIRVRKNLIKTERMMDLYRAEIAHSPRALLEELRRQRERLETIAGELGDCVSPWQLGPSRLDDLGESQHGEIEAEAPQEIPQPSWFR